MKFFSNFFIFFAAANSLGLNYDKEKTSDFKEFLDIIVEESRNNKQRFLSNKSMETIKIFINAGANPNIKNNTYGSSALHFAAQIGDVDFMRTLVQQKANISAKTNSGYTPLHFAADSGHEQAVAELIKLNAHIELVDDQDSSPLIIASKQGHEHIVAQLIALKANVNQLVRNYWTPLMIAAECGHAKIVVLLVRSGASIAKKPIMRGAINGHGQVVINLLSLGSDSGKEALKHAEGSARNILESLFVRGDLVSDKSSINSLIRSNCLRYAKQALLCKPSIINELDQYGISALDIALVNRNIEAILLLLSHGADPLLGVINKLYLSAMLQPSERGYLVQRELYVAIIKQRKILPDEIIFLIVDFILTPQGQ